MNPQAAIRKITLFEKRFGQSHLYLAYHAAFPLALTPDLLYRLWANFQRDIDGRFLSVPWIAVSDILLSSLCEEVGQELYEMDMAVRNELLKRLQADKNLGQQRIRELADFLLEYVRKQLQSNDPDIQDFAKAQRWTVLAYTKPGEAARELASTFQQLGLNAAKSGQLDKAELVRMASLVETFAEPLAAEQLEPLLVYARGMASFARGDLQKAAEQLEQVTEDGKIQIAGVDLPIPEAIQNNLEQSSPPVRQDFSGQNLRGRSFKGQDLTGANFSDTDIRSTDFTNATLIGANFSRAKTGLQRRWATALIAFLLPLFVLLGLSSGLVGTILGAFLYSTWSTSPFASNRIIFQIAFPSLCVIIPSLLLVLCLVTVRQKLKKIIIAIAMAFISSFYFATIVFFTGNWLVFVSINTSNIYIVNLALALGAMLIALSLIFTVNRIKRLPIISALAGIFSVVVALILGVVLTINQVPVETIALIVSLVTILSIVVVTPLTLSGTTSLYGAFLGTLAIPATFAAIFSTASWNAAMVSSTWTLAIGVGGISLMAAAIAWSTLVTVAVTVALVWAEAGSKNFAIGWTLVGIAPWIVGTLVCILRAKPWFEAITPWELESFRFWMSVVGGAILAGLLPLLGSYIGGQAIAKDKKIAAIRNLATAFAAKGGTSFRGANLTDANFTEATLKSADFRTANLTRTCWFHTQKIDHACVEDTYLESPQVQQLVITGMGQAQNFNYLNLQGINLQNANLSDTSFIGTNLSEANLRHTNLSRAKLIQTDLGKADLFGSCLTGAYIQDVKISNATKLSGVECQYIFTRLPTKENPDPARVPEDYRQIFQPGEFASFMQNFIETEQRL